MVRLETDTLGELALVSGAKYGKKTAFQIYRDGGVYDQVSYARFGRRVRQFAALFRALGVRPGDRVMLLSENRPEWAFAFFGTALAGAVSVPVLIDFPEEQIARIADHAGIKTLCGTTRTLPKAASLAGRIPLLRLDGLEGDTIPVNCRGEETLVPLGEPEIGGSFPEENPGSPNQRGSVPQRQVPGDALPPAAGDDLAAIIYTSGTTGRSKGVMLSHQNLLFVARASRHLMKIYSRDRLLSLIPLAHTYECSLGLLTPLLSGASITYLDKPPSPAVLLPAMQTLRPTAIVSVPLFLEKLYHQRIAPALERNPLYRCPLTRFIPLRLAGGRLLASLGGAVRFFGIGGAPLSPEVENFLQNAGFPYSPGYGLTEAAPLVAGSAPYRFRRGSAGKPVPGVELRFVPPEEDAWAGSGENPPAIREESSASGGGCGEIQVRGPNVMKGYYRDEALTREAFTPDGWLRTGDLGFLDRKGCLHIRGRLKALILGPSGENIYPEEIEGLLQSSRFVEDALVVPAPSGELVALIVLSEKAQTAAAAIGDHLEELKARVNRKLAAFSRLARIEIRQTPFEKTATAKIKRYLYTGEAT